MSKDPAVSVIIPTLNGLLRSDTVLLGLERQSYLRNIAEVIVVDDASKNPRKRTVYESMQRRFPRLNITVLYHEKNTGPAGARNTGVKSARGDIIFFTDDDCDLVSNWIEEHLKIYESQPFVSGVGGWYKPYEKDVLKNAAEKFQEIHYWRAYGSHLYSSWDSRTLQGDTFPAINTANLSIRKHVFERVQFDEDFIAPGYEDMFFSESVRRAGYVMRYVPLFVFHHKNLDLKGFVRLCMNRGMGRYVYREKYGIKKKDSYAFHSLGELIQDMSLKDPSVREGKWKLFLLNYVRYFLVHSRIMRSYYRRAYLKRMGHYPKFVVFKESRYLAPL